MLLHTFRCPREGMFTAEIRQHPFQPPGFSPRGDAQSHGQSPQVTLERTAPDPFTHRDQSKNAPPFQRFFLRLNTVAS
jgi:hypothetical protein